MVQKIYSIYDKVTEYFDRPLVFTNEKHAVRELIRLLRQANHQALTSPGDYILYELGEFNDSIGLLKSNTTPKTVMEFTKIFDVNEYSGDKKND